MDGWYPDLEAEKIPVLRGSGCLYRDFKVVRQTMHDDNGKWAIIVVPEAPERVTAKNPSGYRHHFDNAQVRNALLGKDEP